MKIFKFILFILFILFSVNCYSQDCSRFNRWAECRPRINDYNTYLQPKSVAVGVNDTIKFNVVFDGNRDYILSFCANKLYFPIKVRLLKPETSEALYDNTTDGYPQSIGVWISTTQSLIIEISLLADKLGDERLTRNDLVCVGLIMHWNKIFKKAE